LVRERSFSHRSRKGNAYPYFFAFNFNPIHRELNRADFRFLRTALLNWNALPPAEK
jgi:hypothetical protein